MAMHRFGSLKEEIADRPLLARTADTRVWMLAAPKSTLGSVAPEAAHSLPRFPRFKSTAPPERRGIYVSCGSRADEVGIYSISLSEPRPRFRWFALQPTSCRL